MCHAAIFIFRLRIPIETGEWTAWEREFKTGIIQAKSNTNTHAHTCSRPPCWNSEVYAICLIYLQFQGTGTPDFQFVFWIDSRRTATVIFIAMPLLCKTSRETGRRCEHTLSHFLRKTHLRLEKFKKSHLSMRGGKPETWLIDTCKTNRCLLILPIYKDFPGALRALTSKSQIGKTEKAHDSELNGAEPIPN